MVEKPDPLLRNGGASGSGILERGRDDLQSLISSETLGGGGMRSPPGLSNRRRDDSRGPPETGSGPSRRQLLENFGSSSMAPKPGRSFAEGKSISDDNKIWATHGVPQR